MREESTTQMCSDSDRKKARKFKRADRKLRRLRRKSLKWAEKSRLEPLTYVDRDDRTGELEEELPF